MNRAFPAICSRSAQRRARVCVLMMLAAAVLALGPGAMPAKANPDVPAVLDQLRAEAANLDNSTDADPAPRFTQPHPQVRDWGDEQALAGLKAISGRLPGNAYQQAYVRYHVMAPVQAYLQRALKRFEQSGQHPVDPAVSGQLQALANDLPGKLRRKPRPATRSTTPRASGELRRLREQTRIVVGYPPFDRTYAGRAAIPYWPKAQRDRIRRIVQRMDVLRRRVHEVEDPQAQAYNNRISFINEMVREYRRQVIYALAQSGDPDRLADIAAAIQREAGEGQRAAFDLTAPLYRAGFEGYARLYPSGRLQDLARRLERVARSHDRYTAPQWGGEDPPGWYKPEARNLGDFLFHLVHQFRDPEVYVRIGQADRIAPVSPEAIPPRRKVTPQSLTLEDIRAARRRAIRAIYQQPDFAPHYQPISETRLRYILTFGHNKPIYQATLHETGNQALVSWALLAGGEIYQDPRLYKRISWVLSRDVPYTYDRGMRLLMLAQMPPDRWSDWVRRDARWLGDALTKNGNFPYRWLGKDENPWGDHANGQYGVLGLWAAQHSGYPVDDRVWRAIDRHWRLTQQQTPGDAPAGWALGMLGVDTDADRPDDAPDSPQDKQARTVSGPMTAGGVATLALTQRMLHAADRAKAGPNPYAPALRKGLAWLDQNFALRPDDLSTDWAYYMWTIQRVGRATGYRTFNGIDWFRAVTAEVINRQQPDGLWNEPGSGYDTTVTTGFALLYLGAALKPVAIAKLRFDGHWNNHPSDLWNFTDYASDRYEVGTTWQVADLTQRVDQLIEAPLLYLSTDQRFELPKAQVDRLRDYIRAGGLLVANAESTDPGVIRSYRTLAEQLFPDRPFQPVAPDSPLLGLHARLRPSLSLRAVDNGIRPLMVMFTRDISADLQTDQPDSTRAGDAFDSLSNLYLYAVGLRPQRVRLETDHLSPPPPPGVADAPASSRRLTIARLQPQGMTNPEPGADGQLRAMFADQLDAVLRIDRVKPAGLGDRDFALLAVPPDAGKLSEDEARAVKRWVADGGTLWIDAVGGSQAAADAANAITRQLAEGRPIRGLVEDAPVLTGKGIAGAFDNRRVQYRLHTLRQMGPTSRPRLRVVEQGGRPAIVLSEEDLTAGLAGLEHWSILGYSIRSARRLVANAILAAADR